MLPLPAETVNDEYGNNRKPHAKQPPKDRRLSVRVTVLDLENWRFIATELLAMTPLSRDPARGQQVRSRSPAVQRPCGSEI